MQPCRACGRKLHRPIWRRIDHDEYEVLCDICTYMADASFTPEQALLHALIIIGMHQGRLEAQR